MLHRNARATTGKTSPPCLFLLSSLTSWMYAAGFCRLRSESCHCNEPDVKCLARFFTCSCREKKERAVYKACEDSACMLLDLSENELPLWKHAYE